MSKINKVKLDDVLEEKARIERSGRLHWFHWGIVLASLLVTIGAWHFSKTQLEAKNRYQFDREARRIVELVSEGMQEYEDALWGGVAAIHAQDDGIDYTKWKRFSEALHIEKRHPGINGIGVIHHVMPDEVEAYLEAERQLRPNFNIYPKHNEKELFPITYVEPVEINREAVGLDIAHEKNRYIAAKRARDTGLSQITAPITLVQDAEKTPGFLFYAPFYKERNLQTLQQRRDQFVGMVYAPFIFKNLMLGALKIERRHVGIKITDDEAILFDEHNNENSDYDANPIFTSKVIVSMHGRNWVFDISSGQSFRSATSSSKPWMILIGGLTIDALLLVLFLFLAGSNRRAIRFADNMAEEYEGQATHLKNIIDSAVNGLITIDENKCIQSFNPACEKMFGYKSYEIIGENINILMPDLFYGTYDKYFTEDKEIQKKMIIGKGQDLDGKRKDGSLFPLDFSVSEMIVDGQKLYSGILRDITEMKKAEEEIMRSNDELERFAYIASHDLQEPLRMVTNFTGLLEKRYGEQLDARANEYITFASDGAQRMQELVDDLLDYARLGQDGERYETVDVAYIIRMVEDNLRDSIDRSKAVLTYENLPVIYANPVRFIRLLQNLIGNALKYRKLDKPPIIHVSAKQKGNKWLFSIKDNGIGMKPEYYKKIFEPYKRLHGRDEFSGTGMGLTICRKIVEGLGGEMFVESKPDEGSCFCFTIPVSDIKTSGKPQ